MDERPIRAGFVGAFFRPQGAPPFGIFAPDAPDRAPDPYPSPSRRLFGPQSYCDGVAANGVSIAGGHPVDPVKLRDIVELGVGWTRTPAPQFFADHSHLPEARRYDWSAFDAAQCALLRQHIVPTIGLEAGPVLYADAPAREAHTSTRYRSANDFATWCEAVAVHETRTFPTIARYSLPGNEVNSNRELFPDGEPQVASYARACYRAVKRVRPTAIVYGFELNMDGNLDAPGFVERMRQGGCGPGTCYDAIAMHLSLRYPIPPPATPCFPKPRGDYSMRCIEDVQRAAGAPIHVLIGETAYFVPSSIATETLKARAVVDAIRAFSANRFVDGVNYANVDECGFYPTGYFAGGCLVDVRGEPLPAYHALAELARSGNAPAAARDPSTRRTEPAR